MHQLLDVEMWAWHLEIEAGLNVSLGRSLRAVNDWTSPAYITHRETQDPLINRKFRRTAFI